MNLIEGEFYHVFNRGNNKQTIFYRPENYDYFLRGAQKYICPVSDVIAWCLMPNHFHFLIQANAQSIPLIKDGPIERQQFSQAIKQLLSSYAKAINKQENRTGSLFQQKTKAISITSRNHSPTTIFHYIHQNPLKAGLVQKMEDWKYSSFAHYVNATIDPLCNKDLALKYIDVNSNVFYKESYQVINFDFE